MIKFSSLFFRLLLDSAPTHLDNWLYSTMASKFLKTFSFVLYGIVTCKSIWPILAGTLVFLIILTRHFHLLFIIRFSCFWPLLKLIRSLSKCNLICRIYYYFPSRVSTYKRIFPLRTLSRRSHVPSVFTCATDAFLLLTSGVRPHGTRTITRLVLT